MHLAFGKYYHLERLQLVDAGEGLEPGLGEQRVLLYQLLPQLVHDLGLGRRRGLALVLAGLRGGRGGGGVRPRVLAVRHGAALVPRLLGERLGEGGPQPPGPWLAAAAQLSALEFWLVKIFGACAENICLLPCPARRRSC